MSGSWHALEHHVTMRKNGVWSGCRDCLVAEAFDLRHRSPAEDEMVLNAYTTDSAAS